MWSTIFQGEGGGGISEDKDGDVVDKDGDVADKDVDLVDKDGDVADKDGDLVDKDGEADTDIETEHWVFEPQAHLGQNALTPPYLPTRSSSSSSTRSRLLHTCS